MSTKKSVGAALLILTLAACQAPEGADLTAQLAGSPEPAPEATPTPTPTPSPSVSPSPEPTPTPSMKPVLSARARTDGLFTVDLSALVDLDPGAGIQTDGQVDFVFSPTVTCRARVVFALSDEDHGELTISSAYHPGGSGSANTRYCDPLERWYYYSRLSDGTLRVCGATCAIWE